MKEESSHDRRRILKRIAFAGAGLCVADLAKFTPVV